MLSHPPAAASEPARLLLADRTMYAVHPIPLSEVKAIRKHAPSFGWQYIVLVLVNGLTLPPLYFGTGGVRALFAALKQVHQPTGHQVLTSCAATLHSCLTLCRVYIPDPMGRHVLDECMRA